MKTRAYLAVLAASCFSVFPAAAQQQVTGTPGAPSATTTIDGQSLPAAPPPFGGVINLDAQHSTPWWPPTVVPPKGAPNVLLIITDDAGYGVSGTFGGLIPTPTLDQIAANGLRYTQFHSTALCSPTRAALITGRNHHSSGFGVIAEQATGFPGYDSIIGPDNATIGNILKDHGYATSWFGKNHNTPTYAYSTSGPFDQWPSGMGFDYFYGFMGGETNQWTPWLFRDHTQIFPWRDQPGYNLVTGMADDAITYLRQIDAVTPEKPFLLYYAPGATHAPHHPTQEWIDKFKGKFDMGWNAMRDEIFANQKRLGVIPEKAQLTPWPDDLPKWDTLDADSKKMFARQAEVFAAYVAYADHEIGRVVDEVRRQGKLDNTLIIYIEGDNGTSAEGSTIGTAFDLAAIQGINMPVADQLKYYDAWGSDVTTPHMSVAWSWAFDTPFKWTKQIASHFGGTRQGMAMSWPGHITDKGGIRSQFHHVIDIVPTILEAAGIEAPQTVNGIPQKPIEGTSMAYTWAKGSANVPSTRTTQYFEMFGDRAIYHDGWIASTTPPAGPWLLGLGKLPDVLDGYNWELYDLTKDFTQFDDLAAKEPAKLKELQDLFLVEAAKYHVFPLDNRVATRFGQQPSATAGRDTFTYTGQLSGLPPSAAPSPLNRSYTITADIEVPEGGGEGVINTLGGRFGGYGLYLLKGKPVFTYNLLGLERFRWEGTDGLTPGKHSIVFDFAYDGPGFGKGGTGVLSVDGTEAAKQTIPHTIPFVATIDESFDVGIDTRSPVDDNDYQVPFRFTGTLDKLTVKVGPPQI
ncbi:arylsulfatase [Rhizobium tubonense]|uniref:Arylsulfatase n=1 Tax=Rhizobium tubonense TaxID=484088 RepID=A0A2W4C187_9HYPH|nr:arylsulfatase [Rhizobium tubonense]PZM07432.1 arylsulfatase [Rhizobium tubonense]